MQAKAASWFKTLAEAASSLTRFQRSAIAILVALLCLGSVLAYTHSRPRPVAIREAGATVPGRERVLTVHVAGAVANPGLYRMDEGSRVADALQKAGGPAPDAALDDLNLAGRLSDGQKVMVPRKAAQAQATDPGRLEAPAVGSSLVNLNTATEDELDELPGVGPALASRIIEYRKKNGPFSTIEELDSVSGIGPAKLDSIRDLVTI